MEQPGQSLSPQAADHIDKLRRENEILLQALRDVETTLKLAAIKLDMLVKKKEGNHGS